MPVFMLIVKRFLFLIQILIESQRVFADRCCDWGQYTWFNKEEE